MTAAREPARGAAPRNRLNSARPNRIRPNRARPNRPGRPAADGPVVVIGGGISGLATAALLARDGRRVTLLEQQDTLGGRAGRWAKDGFAFDIGPSWYLMPEVIDHWFRLMGTSAAAELDLVRLEPGYRVWFSGDGPPADVPSDPERVAALFEDWDTGSGARLRRYLDSARQAYGLARRHFLYDDFDSLRGLLHPDVLRTAPRLLGMLGTSLDRFVAKRFRDRRQRQILGYPAVFLGTTPFKAPSLYHLMSHLDLEDGVLYPRGGFAALVDAMARLAREHGVDIRTGATARRILTGPAGGIGPGGIGPDGERRGGEQCGGEQCGAEECEAVLWTDADGTEHRTAARVVVGAADLHHVETRLLGEPQRSHPEAAWARRDPGPSAVLVCLGINGPLPELAHHNLLFTPDWRDNFGRIDAGRDLAAETSIYACKPSATDPGVAPAGDENLFILVPSPAVPEWGHGGHDGGGSPKVEQVADAAIAQLARWAGIPELAGRIAVRRTFGPADFRDSLNAWNGSALGAAHTLRQSAFLRPGIRSRRVEGLFYAGASVRPGIGVPMCLISAELVLKAVRGDRVPGPVGEPPVGEAPAAQPPGARAGAGGAA
ncbi:phytoene desaturase family protein [Arthrobacter ginkgonis]|uniref:Phytoene desaturase family protein n=1 Tax=Arthrobacter ginkgonis TaxID=1630594 RepID=A0ABP7C1T3_9MICC